MKVFVSDGATLVQPGVTLSPSVDAERGRIIVGVSSCKLALGAVKHD